MANNALALNVATPTIDPVGAFEVGQQAGTEQAMAKLAQAEAALKHLGSLAFGVMGGKLDGPVDPALWDEAVATLGPEGAKYRGRPDLAPILAKASVDTLGQLQIVQNERELDQRLEEFQFKVDEAAKPLVINGQLVDQKTHEVLGDYRTTEAPKPPEPLVINNQIVDPATRAVLGDYRTPETPKAPQIETVFDEKSGTERKVQWNPSTMTWENVGGAKREPPKLTDDMVEYQAAVRGGYAGTFMEYQKELRQSGATKVNVGPDGIDYGDPGTGLVWQRDQAGSITLDERGAPVAIPFKGGKLYVDQADTAAALAAAQANKDTKAGIVIEDADRALEKVKKDPFWTSGLMGNWLSQLGGSPAADVKRLIDTVKANAGFAELQAMREASPTGGALGQVTERELQFLQSVIGSLEQDQSAEQLVANLERVKGAFLDIVHGPGNRPDQKPAARTVQDWTTYF
jgi:hypothetical protein